MARPSQKSAPEGLLLLAIYIPIPIPKGSYAQSTWYLPIHGAGDRWVDTQHLEECALHLKGCALLYLKRAKVLGCHQFPS